MDYLGFTGCSMHIILLKKEVEMSMVRGGKVAEWNIRTHDAFATDTF